MQSERLAIEASARSQGGFTSSQWDRFCELEDLAMAPIIANARQQFIQRRSRLSAEIKAQDDARNGTQGQQGSSR